jgi:hypothetical protein
MKRSIAICATVAVAAVAAGPAQADPGSPGTTFPEQPGTNNQQSCAAILSNPGATTAPRSLQASKITTNLFVDACLGG